MGFSENGATAGSPASLAAEAAVQALQGTKSHDGASSTLRALLGSGVKHSSVQLVCGDTLCCSGNLLASEHATSLLATGNTLASAAVAARSAKLLRE